MSENAPAKGRLGPAVAAGAAAAVAYGALWAALVVLTERELGFAAVGIGGAAAGAVRLASRGLRGPALQKAAIGCSLFGFILEKYFVVAYSIRDMLAHRPENPLTIGYLDPRVFKFFFRILPHMLTVYADLCLLLALAAAWLILRPAGAPRPPEKQGPPNLISSR